MIIRAVATPPPSNRFPKTLERFDFSSPPIFYSKPAYYDRLHPFLRGSYPNPSNPTFVSRPRAFSLPLPPSLNPVKPYLQSEWDTILKGWLFSAISVYCLSSAVPKIGNLSSVLFMIEPNRMVEECLVLVGLALVRSTASYLQQAFLWEAALRSAYKIRVDVFDRLLQRDLGFFEGRNSVPAGDVAHRITAEVSDVADTLYALLNSTIPNTFQLLAMASRMVSVNPVLSLISALVIPFASLVIANFGERLRRISQKAHFSVGRLSAYLNEILPSMLVVKANNAELNESFRFQRLAHDDLTKHLKKKKMKALIPQITQFTFLGGLLMLCAGSMVVSEGSFNASTIVPFITALALMVEPIQGIGKAYNELKQGEPAIERLFELTKFNSQVVEKQDACDLDSVRGDVKFSGVTFKYGDDMPPILNELNLHIKPGEIVCLVGPSGGGKTTLVKLLLRLYDPLSGCILVDDQDIQNVRLRSLRKHIALVSQDIVLFSGTVAENIAYKDLMVKINMEHVRNAARIANAEEFIMTLPEGYASNIGPRGSLLSGGQKQRIAIARALYEQSSILILDEATSALDYRSEMLVRQALERLMVNHTVLVIAHRLETVQMADRIFLLNGGKLEEVSRLSFFAQDGHYGSLLSSGPVV